MVNLKKHPNRRRAMTFLRLTHRWTSLVLGLFLVILTTSGSILVVGQYVDGQSDHAGIRKVTPSINPVSMDTALATLRERYPEEGFNSISLDHGAYSGYGDTNELGAFVDPGTGAVTGTFSNKGQHGWYRFIVNLHDCLLSCEDYPGSMKWLTKHPLDVGIPGEAKLTWSSLFFFVLGFLMFTLVVGGVVLWWPGIRRWRRGFQVRASKNRYARDYDLHKLVGIVALPPLFIWGLTGMQFGAPIAKNTIDALLPGKTTPNDYSFVSKERPGADVGFDAALAAARAKNGGGRLIGYTAPVPVKDDPTAVYSITLAKGFEWYGKDSGTNSYAVDRHDATRVSLDTYAADNPSQFFTGNPVFAGHFVSIGANRWWDEPFRWTGFVFGMTPLFLMITGLSTWLYKRKLRKRSRARRRDRAGTGEPDRTPVPA